MGEASKLSTIMDVDGSSKEEVNDSKYLAHEIILKYTVSMTLKAVLTLGIPDILNTEGGKPLTAEEILAKMPTAASPPTAGNVKNLSRTLRIMVLEGFFTESFNDKKQSLYGLTDVSKWFIKTAKINMLPIADFYFRYDIPELYTHLPNSILDDNVVPFQANYGMPVHEYAMKNPDFGVMFQNLMIAYSNVKVDTVIESLEKYNVLEGVNTLVDVGGSTGRNVADIIAKYPYIKGINMDLPHVIAHAPQVEGVTNVPGNMFESVPSGDVMLVKWILHNHDDRHCVKILMNCLEALPKKGKVLIVEYILEDGPDNTRRARMVATLDLIMNISLKGAQERTKAEYEKIIAAAGFSHSEFIRGAESMDLIIAYKK